MKHESRITAAAFSPDGQTMLTGSYDRSARLWDASTGAPIDPLLFHQGWVFAVAFSPDGKTVLTGCMDDTARLWDAATGSADRRPLDPSRLGHGRGLQPRRQDGLDRQPRPDGPTLGPGHRQPIGGAMQHQGPVMAVAFRPDGKAVLTASGDNTVRLWPIVELPDDLDRVTTWVSRSRASSSTIPARSRS